MTKEELIQRKKELEDRVVKLHAKQLSIKVLVNSCYGLTN